MIVNVSPFSSRMRADVQQQMWQVWSSGYEMDVAGQTVGFCRKTVYTRIAEAGGIRPRRGRRPSKARLSYEDRVHIEIGLKQGRSMRAIAADLDRAPSTISREVNAHRRRDGGYGAKHGHAIAFEAAKRPQQSKIEANPILRERIIDDLGRKRSPEQIAGRLAKEFPADRTMRVHHEAIYRFIYLQPRGELKRQVAQGLRTGQIMRKPKRRGQGTGPGRIPNMVSISERPAVDDVDGSRLPGHWEGDLIIGKENKSAIGTVVERATGYLMLLHLPHNQHALPVAEALTQRLIELPESLRQSLTWDQGREMNQHAKVSIDAGINVYFADPRSPWQRPSNENVNGLLRQYFPKGTDLSAHSPEDLLFVEQEMNDRPRKRLDYAKPQELMVQLMLAT